MADQNLKSLFASAERKRYEIEKESNIQIRREYLTEAIAFYQSCRQLADRISLFSPNETCEDIASSDLQYLLIDYQLAELFNQNCENDRILALRKARKAYEQFLTQLDHYELLETSNKKLFELYTESPQTFSTVSTTDANARRNAKISNFAHEKELKKRLKFLSQNPAYLQNDDDAVRQTHLVNLRLCAHNALQSLETINRETEVLAMAPILPSQGPESLEKDYRERNGTSGDNPYSDRLDRPISELMSGGSTGPILSSKGKPLRPFTLLDKRQQLQKGVFRPGHNLPTMSIDEYLDEERRRGGIIEGGGEASGLAPEPDEDNLERADVETMKAREWDEFVEANPKGSGNTLNRG